jgi:arylsulfatase A-like enzyme
MICIGLASVAVMSGLITGMPGFLNRIDSEQYLQDGLFRLSLHLFRTSLNRWTIPFMGVAGIAGIILLIYGSLSKSSESGIERMAMTRRSPRRFQVLLALFFALVSITWCINSLGIPQSGLPGIPGSAGITTGIVGVLILVWFIVSRYREYLIRVVDSVTFRVIATLPVLLWIGLNLYLKADSVQLRKTTRPNIVVILVDALRRDHVGTYGYPRSTTPNLDRFSALCKVIPDVTSQCSWTSPSVASMFTGLYPGIHGVTSFSESGRLKTADILDYRLTTAAEVAKNSGYQTAAFVANKWISCVCGFHQGFDLFDTLDPVFKPRADSLNKSALTWISDQGKQPFFAYLHYMDVHGPYDPPQPYGSLFNSEVPRPLDPHEKSRLKYLSAGDAISDLRYYIDRYDGEIRYTDRHIGQILRFLADQDLMSNTLIVITSDHGEAFFEHGYCDHGWTLYGEETSVPLMVKLPDTIQTVEYTRSPVELTAVIRQLFSTAGLPFPIEKTTAIDRGNPVSDKQSYGIISAELSETMKNPPVLSIRSGGYKGIYSPDSGHLTELYNLDQDPGEIRNCLTTHGEIQRFLESLISAHLAETALYRNVLQLGATGKTAIEPDRIKQLRSLGYVQ